MKDTDKVTLTYGQLKKLIKESNEGYTWIINEIIITPHGNKIEYFNDSGMDFEDRHEAYEDGLYELERCPNDGTYEMVVMKARAEYRASNFIYRATKRKGKVWDSKNHRVY